MKEIPTPLTNGFLRKHDFGANVIDALEFARQLERDRAELIEALRDVEEALEDGHWQHTKEAIRALLERMK